MKWKRIFAFIKFTLVFMIIFLIINLLSAYFSERVRLYVRQKAILQISDIIATTIQTEVLPTIDTENLIILNTSDTKKVESIYINTYQINKIVADTARSVTNKMKEIDQNQDLVNLTLPMGDLISDVLFNDLGPDIEITVRPIGSATVDVITGYEHYGINNSLFTVSIQVKAMFSTLIPLRKDEVEIISKIPIVVQVIQGEVPRYYVNVKDPSMIPYPIEE